MDGCLGFVVFIFSAAALFIAWRARQASQHNRIVLEQLQARLVAVAVRLRHVEVWVQQQPAARPVEEAPPGAEAPAAGELRPAEEPAPAPPAAPPATPTPPPPRVVETPTAAFPVAAFDLRSGEKAEETPTPAQLLEPGPPPASAEPPAAPPEAPPAPPEPVASPPSDASPPSPPPRRPARPSPPTPPPSPSRPTVDWERWLGVRGAAVLAGVFLALAGIFLFKYSIEQGWISPSVRVAMATVVGIGAVLGSERLRRRDYEAAANALAGGGFAVLYAGFWAAHNLYALVGPVISLLLMVVVTAACAVLAAAHGSLVIAVLGLAGGFLTPLMISSLGANSFGLLTYLLLLDAGLLALARHRRWPVLAFLSLAATALHQAFLFVFRLGPGEGLGALVFLFLSTLLFVGIGEWRRGGRSAEEEDEAAQGLVAGLTRVGAVLLAFAFAFLCAVRGDFAVGILPLGIFLTLLAAGACWVGARRREDLLPLGAAGACLAVVAGWLLTHSLTGDLAWRVVGVAILLALPFALSGYRSDRGRKGLPMPVAVITGGLFLLLTATAVATPLPVASALALLAPWLLGWLVLGALVVDLGHRRGAGWMHLVVAVAVGVAFFATCLVQASARLELVWEPALLIALGLALLFSGLALWRRRVLAVAGEMSGQEEADSGSYPWAERGALVVPLLMQLLLWIEGGEGHFGGTAGVFYPWSLLFGLLVALAAIRLGQECPDGQFWFLAAPISTFLVHAAHTSFYTVARGPAWPFWSGLTAVGMFTVLPFISPPAFRRHGLPWRAGATAGGTWLVLLVPLYRELFGPGRDGLLPVLLGLLAIAGVYGVQRLRRGGEEGAPWVALVWFSAAAISLAAVAVPLQLSREWITLGWAAQGVALVALWRRLDHPGLKFFALGLLGLATARLLVNPALLSYYPREGLPVLNWLAYTYLLPALALLGAGRLLKPLEVERAREWEAVLYDRGRAVLAFLCGLAATLLIFAWVNLAIFHAFGTGTRLILELEPAPGRTLALTLAWAAFALALAWLWWRRDEPALKYGSLALFAAVACRLAITPVSPLPPLYRGWAGFFELAAFFWLPCLAIVGTGRLLKPRERERLRPWEAGLPAPAHGLGALCCGAVAVGLIFLWVNLAIAYVFGSEVGLTWEWKPLPGEALTFPLAWVGFALGLLGLRRWELDRGEEGSARPGLRGFALLLLGLVALGLTLGIPLIIALVSGEGTPVANGLALLYLGPAAGLLVASRLLREEWKGRLAGVLGGAAVLLTFLWINLAILHAFATGNTLFPEVGHLPARDLTMSLAWALYALLLLALGLHRRSRAPRAVALGLLALTAVKVFLYDLGELTDLYRVASLFGLAISLFVVSLAYQRFVLRGDKRGGEEEP